MLIENFDATGAALQVGYESVPQFTREYRRLFGQPPLRDVKQRRGVMSVPVHAASKTTDPRLRATGAVEYSG